MAGSRLGELEALVQAASAERIEGSADEVELQYLAELAQEIGAVTVGETGFNAGYSSLALLEATPNTRVVSFDIGYHEYISVAKRYIDEQFERRHHLVVGDSTQTVPRYSRENPNASFDLVFIDGGHDHSVARADLLNMRRLSHKSTVVVMDDLVPWKPWGVGPMAAWQNAMAEGLIIQDEIMRDGSVVETIEPPGNRVWARGRYVF